MFVLRRTLVDKDINGHRVKQSHAPEDCRCTLLFSVFIAPSLVTTVIDVAFYLTAPFKSPKVTFQRIKAQGNNTRPHLKRTKKQDCSETVRTFMF